MRSSLKIIIALFLFGSVLSSCKKDIQDESSSSYKKVADFDYKVVYEWNLLWMELERHAAGYRPCPTADVLGYMGLANYEACVSGMPEYASLASLYQGLNVPKTFANQEYHWPTVVNTVNNYLFSRLLPEIDKNLYARIKELADKNEKLYTQAVNQDVFLRSKNHGEAVAAVFWNWMKTDVVAFDGYKDPFKENNWKDRLNQPGAWTPTIPGPGEGMFPYWGKARTLAIKEDMKICRDYRNYVGEFSEKTNSIIYAQATEVLAHNTPTLSYQNEWVGEFWSDDLVGLTFSPPTRFIAIANQAYEKENSRLDLAILCNAKIGMALHDAAIGCWNSKYHYNIERPESYIKRLIDPSWEPNLENPLTGDKGISPSFPAYPSGHATFSGASCEILGSIFGYSYGMTDNCHRNRSEFTGYPRTFSSFSEMALENAWSRVPLGVHYRMDAEEGVRYGTEIGRVVNKLPWKK